MITLIKNNQSALEQLCRQYGVRRLELFGSALCDENFAKNSDLDFLVEFLPLQWGQKADAYFGLLEALEALFGRSIDLVVAKAIRNPYFRAVVDQTRELLYAA